MGKQGVLSFKRKDRSGRFMYNFRISDYHAAKILEYIAQIPHEPEPFRDSKGRFTSPSKTNDGGSDGG